MRRVPAKGWYVWRSCNATYHASKTSRGKRRNGSTWMLMTSSILSRLVGTIIGSKLLTFLDALSLSNGSRVSCPHKSSWSVLCFHDDFSCLTVNSNLTLVLVTWEIYSRRTAFEKYF